MAEKEKVYSLSSIRFGIDAEIDAALNVFCKDELSKVYWPKAFRTLASHILQSVLRIPDRWRELSTTIYEVDENQLITLIEELKQSTSYYIKVKQRSWIVHLLREISLLRKKFGIGNRMPKMSFQNLDWPLDLEDKDDLASSMTDMTLREDVRSFLWTVLNEVIPVDKYCNVHYFGAIRMFCHSCPIVIEVAEGFVNTLKDRIETVSANLRSTQQCENLLPFDVVNIKAVPDRELAPPLVEGWHTSGSPWKEGTVGAIVKSGPHFFGITSGHLHRKAMHVFDDICADTNQALTRFIDETVDVAFFKFVEFGEATGNLFNLLPMKYVGVVGDIDLKIGEPVYKVGRSTGLTVGKLGSIQSTVRFARDVLYVDHVQVIWNEDDCRFAFSMDCGSIYCVQRGPMYIPIGIHRISEANISYGCSIWKAMHYFPDESDISFVNPPYLVI